MGKPIGKFGGYCKSRRGQGVVEYALLLILVVAVVVTALASIGDSNPGGNPMQSVAQTLEDS